MSINRKRARRKRRREKARKARLWRERAIRRAERDFEGQRPRGFWQAGTTSGRISAFKPNIAFIDRPPRFP